MIDKNSASSSSNNNDFIDEEVKIGSEEVEGKKPYEYTTLQTKKDERRAKTARILSNTLAYSVLILLTIIWLYPIFWIVVHAFRGADPVTGAYRGIVISNYFPGSYGIEAFRRLFTETYFLRWFVNTLFVAVLTCFFATMLQLSVAYVMSKLKFPQRRFFLNLAIILGLFPGFMSMIAIYYILKAFGLTETLFALVLVYSAGAGLGFYIAKGFFDVIPNSLIEAARLDGATNAKIFSLIVLPISKPIIVYTALMTFTAPWFDFLFARVILGETNTEIHTVAVGLYMMLYGPQADVSMFTVFAAGSVLVAVPIVTLFLSMQRYYVEGVTSGAVKG